MVRLGLLYIWFYCALLRNSSDANKVIVGRAEAKSGEIEVDFFIFTDKRSCVNYVNDVTPWCNQRNAYSLSSLPGISFQYKCSCQCKYNVITFLLDERRCVNEVYLMIRFGSGKFLLDSAIDLTNNDELDTKNNMDCHNRDCYVNKVEYRKANDVWQEMDSNKWSVKLKHNVQKLKWKKSDVAEENGKIIRIQICGQQGCSTYNQTLFCKSRGRTSLDITDVTPTPTTSAATSSTLTLTATASAVISSTVTPTPTTSAVISSTIIPPSTASKVISSTVAFSPMYTSKMKTVPAMYTLQPSKGSRHNKDEAGPPIRALVGAVIACIVVIVMIIVIFIIWKRRKQTSRKPTKVAIDSTGNPTYLQNQGEVIPIPDRQVNDGNVKGNEEYDYAAVDGGPNDYRKTSKPIYQSLIKENVQDSVYTPLSKEAPNSTPEEYSYNHLQHPQYNPARSKKDPLYNTLEPPNNDEYLEPGTQISDNPTGVSEPVYNVLEGPDPNSDPQDKDPVYNVLEDPNNNQYSQDNDPVYNVLEDPNANQYPQDNDPVYNVLEDPDDNYDNAPIDDDQDLPAPGQDNVAYSSTIDLNLPQSPSSPDYDVLEGPDSALPDSTYQALGIRVQDDVYQPLDRTSQPIYQSLEPNDSTA